MMARDCTRTMEQLCGGGARGPLALRQHHVCSMRRRVLRGVAQVQLCAVALNARRRRQNCNWKLRAQGSVGETIPGFDHEFPKRVQTRALRVCGETASANSQNEQGENGH